MSKHGNNFNAMAQIEDFISEEAMSRVRSEIVTSPEINPSLCGTIAELSKSYAKCILPTTPDMIVDNDGLIHSGFVFAAANYAAQAAINKEFSILISSKSNFYAPLKFGDTLVIEAQALFDENSKKREVKLIGHVNDIKVFEGNMQIIVTDEHIFKLKRPPVENAPRPAGAPQDPNIPPHPIAAASAAMSGGAAPTLPGGMSESDAMAAAMALAKGN